MDTVVKLLMNVLSRKFEFQAGKPSLQCWVTAQQSTNISSDEFAVKLGYSQELAKSLIKLQIQNLSIMDADWLYASYHFSHPILPERLGALGWYGDEKKTDEKQMDGAKPTKASDREL